MPVRRHLVLFFMIHLWQGCAGPTDPFGGSVWRQKVAVMPVLGESTEVDIQFDPPFQNWHENRPITITINTQETISPMYEVRYFYNGRETTQDLEDQVIKEWQQAGKRLVLHFPKLRFLPGRDNQLAVYFRPNPLRDFSMAHYRTPECSLQDQWAINETMLPSSGRSLTPVLHKTASARSINPALITGLIQQESNFNSLAVSYAKAIGLTQVTPQANKEILKLNADWPTDPRSEELPASVVRVLVQTGVINKSHDWRLDQQRSIQGGLTYLQYLERLWQLPEYRLTLATLQRPVVEDILLASYHSGPNRVRDAIRLHGEEWSLSSELRQARYYIGKVKSYCSLHAPYRVAKR